MSEVSKQSVGNFVTYIDEYRIERPALVTAVWSQTCINIVFVSGDEKRTDIYGRQIVHETSVSHISTQGQLFGKVWK